MPKMTTGSEEWLASECNRVVAKAASVPLAERSQCIKNEIAKLQVGDILKTAMENMILSMENAVTESSASREKIFTGVFSVAFMIVMLVIAIRYPHPTDFQFFVFRVVLAIAAGGAGGMLSGFLTIVLGNSSKPWLRAGGGLAVLVLVYLLNPAKLIVQ